MSYQEFNELPEGWVYASYKDGASLPAAPKWSSEKQPPAIGAVVKVTMTVGFAPPPFRLIVSTTGGPSYFAVEWVAASAGPGEGAAGDVVSGLAGGRTGA